MPIGLGPWELIIILLIVVVIFGAGKLADIGGALGKGIREFRSATKDDTPPATPTANSSGAAPQAGATTTVVAPVEKENKCASCGTVNPAGQTFCGQCGNRVGQAA